MSLQRLQESPSTNSSDSPLKISRKDESQQKTPDLASTMTTPIKENVKQHHRFEKLISPQTPSSKKKVLGNLKISLSPFLNESSDLTPLTPTRREAKRRLCLETSAVTPGKKRKLLEDTRIEYNPKLLSSVEDDGQVSCFLFWFFLFVFHLVYIEMNYYPSHIDMNLQIQCVYPSLAQFAGYNFNNAVLHDMDSIAPSDNLCAGENYLLDSNVLNALEVCGCLSDCLSLSYYNWNTIFLSLLLSNS